MANTFRFRHVDVDEFLGAVDSATVIEIGDLLYLDSGDVKPANSQADQYDEDKHRFLFASKFAGVAMQASNAGDTDAIRVATDGIFEFACSSDTWDVGDLVGANEDFDGGPENQQVELVLYKEHAIGFVVQQEKDPVESVRVRLMSRLVGVRALCRQVLSSRCDEGADKSVTGTGAKPPGVMTPVPPTGSAPPPTKIADAFRDVCDVLERLDDLSDRGRVMDAASILLGLDNR